MVYEKFYGPQEYFGDKVSFLSFSTVFSSKKVVRKIRQKGEEKHAPQNFDSRICWQSAERLLQQISLESCHGNGSSGR
jgi:hypothetical protein